MAVVRQHMHTSTKFSCFSTRRYGGQADGWLPEGRGARGQGEKGEGIEKYRLVVTKSSMDVQHSTGNTVNDTVITTCGARRVLEI